MVIMSYRIISVGVNEIMERGLISVIIPVYNVEDYLDRCIKSVISQTYASIEIILVDDGSTDLSGEKCDFYGRLDERIRIIHKQNGGLSSARNAGIEIANGEYLSFIDSDDYVNEKMIESMYRAIRDNNVKVAICNYLKQTTYIEDSEEISDIDWIMEDSKRSIEKLMSDGSSFYTPIWNKLYHYSCFDGLRFPEGRNAEDVATIYKIYYVCDGVVYTTTALYYYGIRENNLSNKNCFQFDDSLLAIRERSAFFKNKDYDLYILSEINRMRVLIWYYVRLFDLKNKKNIIKEYKEAYMQLKRYCKRKDIMFCLFNLSPNLYSFIWSMVRIVKKTTR